MWSGLSRPEGLRVTDPSIHPRFTNRLMIFSYSCASKDGYEILFFPVLISLIIISLFSSLLILSFFFLFFFFFSFFILSSILLLPPVYARLSGPPMLNVTFDRWPMSYCCDRNFVSPAIISVFKIHATMSISVLGAYRTPSVSLLIHLATHLPFPLPHRPRPHHHL